MRDRPGISMIVSPPRRFIQAVLIVLGIGVIGFLVAGAVVVPDFPGQTTIRDAENHRLLAGLLFFLPGLIGYRIVRQVEEQSDELRRAVALTPGKFIRSELAKSPSAGAIIGFIAIFMGFTMATDLFLEPSSVASFLSNVATKGVIAIGVTYLMISGEFDLSVGSILGVTALSFMNFMTHGAPVFGVVGPIPAALLAIFSRLRARRDQRRPAHIHPNTILYCHPRHHARLSRNHVGGDRGRPHSAIQRPPHRAPGDRHQQHGLLGAGGYRFGARRLHGISRTARIISRGRGRLGPSGRTTAISALAAPLCAASLFILVLLILLAIVVWLVAVLSYHGSASGGQIVEVGYFDLFNGRVLAIGEEGDFFHMQIPRNANVRLAIVWWFIFVVIFHIVLTNTSFGNSIFATGGNEGAARAQGVNVDRVKLQNFVIVALLTGIAAIYETARNPGVDPLKGTGWELEVIAMTVIGGALLTGGYGSVVGSLLGALIFGMLQTGLVLVGIESRLFSGTIGVIIIAAVVLNTLVRGARQN